MPAARATCPWRGTNASSTSRLHATGRSATHMGNRFGSRPPLVSTSALPSSSSRSTRTTHAIGPPSPLATGVQPSGSLPSSTSGEESTMRSGSAVAAAQDASAATSMATSRAAIDLPQRSNEISGLELIAAGCAPDRASGRPRDRQLHYLVPGVRALHRKPAWRKPGLRRSLDTRVLVGVRRRGLEVRFQSRILAQQPADVVTLHRDACPPAACAPFGPMVPFQQLQQDQPQRARELVVLLAPHVIELLGNILRVGLGDTAGAQERRLFGRPSVEIAIVACTRSIALGGGTFIHDRRLRERRTFSFPIYRGSRSAASPRWCLRGSGARARRAARARSDGRADSRSRRRAAGSR